AIARVWHRHFQTRVVRLLTTGHDGFHEEARDVLRAGLASAAWITGRMAVTLYHIDFAQFYRLPKRKAAPLDAEVPKNSLALSDTLQILHFYVKRSLTQPYTNLH